MGFIGVKLKSLGSPGTVQAGASTPLPVPIASVSSPDDQLSQAVIELRHTAIADLLEILGNVSPGFFETIVLDLLHRIGYGANRTDLKKVGGSGDAGIDGVISLDRLGLEKVYVQAKRWQQIVGRPELQAFYGALAGQKAKKGVFITTSAFTTQAKEFVKSVEGIVMIDGPRLAELMIECELGITSRTIKIPKIDSDYFDEEEA
jgi:restriction system protein